MAENAEKFVKRIQKLLAELPVPSNVYNELYTRAEKELEIIKEKKLFDLFKAKKDKKLASLNEVLADERLSVVGYLTKSLYHQESTAISSLSEFESKLAQLKILKQGSISEKQVKELILFGVFGDPEQNMTEYL